MDKENLSKAAQFLSILKASDDNPPKVDYIDEFLRNLIENFKINK